MEKDKEKLNMEEKEDITKKDKKESETNNDITEEDYNELNNDISKMLIEMKKEKDSENDNLEEDDKELNNYDLDFFSSNTISTCSMDFFDQTNNDKIENKSNSIINNNNPFEKKIENLNMINPYNSIQNDIKFDSDKKVNNNTNNNLDNNNNNKNIFYNNNLDNNDNNNFMNIYKNVNNNNININENIVNNIDNNNLIFNNKESLSNHNLMNNYLFNNINNKFVNNISIESNNGTNLNKNINLNNNIYNFFNTHNLHYNKYFSFSSFSAEKNLTNIDTPNNIIHIDNILKGKDKRTTIIMRNIPYPYMISKLLREINKKFYHKYDVVYLPKNNNNNTNFGFAFINFIDYMHLVFFCDLFEGKKWNCINCNKRCQLAYSKFQGKNELLNYIHKKLGINSDFNTNDNLKNSFFINDSDKYAKPPIELPIKYFISFKTYYPYSLCHSKNDKIFVVDKF